MISPISVGSEEFEIQTATLSKFMCDDGKEQLKSDSDRQMAHPITCQVFLKVPAVFQRVFNAVSGYIAENSIEMHLNSGNVVFDTQNFPSGPLDPHTPLMSPPSWMHTFKPENKCIGNIPCIIL